MKDLILLGSTGSIGRQTLDIIRNNPDKFNLVGMSCNSNIELLREQIEEFKPKVVAIADENSARIIKSEFDNLDVLSTSRGLCELVKYPADIVLNALMGISGLKPTYEAIISGKDIALANKETLVTGGQIIVDAIKENSVNLFPIDSEHSAIFQCLKSSLNSKVKRIILTASGGPFRGYSLEDLKKVKLDEALNHPKWKMGKKISIDSATMMNKGLEVIEARWLFDIKEDNIEVHIHPESIIHSAVEFEDNSIIAQMGTPDMRIPISLALNYPDRLKLESEKLDLFEIRKLSFERPNRQVFRCLDIAYNALKEGSGATIAMNGANEELVNLFLNKKIQFIDIQENLEILMERESFESPKSIDDIMMIDKEARAIVREIIGKN